MFVVFIAVFIVLLPICYILIMRRGKKCKECGEKYDSSCILDAKVTRTIKSVMGMDNSDVEVIMKCKKCEKIKHVQVTVKGSQSKKYLDEELKRHFDK